LKFLTKLAANRLQEVIKKTIHVNQYGFIKDRTIQDCLGWAFEYIHQCQQSKRKIVVIKIDFEKAFDTLDHEAIIQIMRAKGYQELFLQWVREVLSSGSSSILLNGVPGKSFHCKRGVRQGDPLSPLLFAQGADLLQSLVNWAFHNGMLSLPIPVDVDFPIIQYADDTIIVLPANLDQLAVIKDILNQYATFTGLKINFHKSSMIPINLSDEEASFLAEEFNCQLGSMPFTYLGLPMGATKPSIKDLFPLTDRVERRLSAVSSFLSYGDRLVLVNSVLSSLPTYFLLSLKLPPGIIDVIDRARRHCLWKRKNKDKINSLAAWEMVCRPKSKGGLGIINLRVQNNALFLKHLHKFYNNEDIPWIHLVRDAYYHQAVPHAVVLAGSFWWKSIISLSDEYRSITKSEVGNGSSVLFWSDLWKDNLLDSSFPRLFSYAKDKLQLVKEFFERESVLDNFHLSLSVQAHEEMADLQVILHNASLNPESNESWIFKLGTKCFRPSKVYKQAFDHIATDHPSCWMEK
jgi:hypothetical protein